MHVVRLVNGTLDFWDRICMAWQLTCMVSIGSHIWMRIMCIIMITFSGVIEGEIKEHEGKNTTSAFFANVGLTGL